MIVLYILQVLSAVVLIGLTAVTQTKSEQGGSGMGWGTLGGKSSSSIAGLEDRLVQFTTWAAGIFLFISLLVGIWNAKS